jgi:hypothetical protein
VIAGRIERLHDPKVCWGGADGKWRLNACAEKPLESIWAVADGLGVGVQQAKWRGRPVKSKKTVDEEVMEGA